MFEKANIIYPWNKLCYGHKTVLLRASELALYGLEPFNNNNKLLFELILITAIDIGSNQGKTLPDHWKDSRHHWSTKKTLWYG